MTNETLAVPTALHCHSTEITSNPSLLSFFSHSRIPSIKSTEQKQSRQTRKMPDADADFFDEIFGIEDRFFEEGYAHGVREGERAGYTEGCVFGVEKGFDKFGDMGRFFGKAIVWAKRLDNAGSDNAGDLLLPSNNTGANTPNTKDAAAAAATTAETHPSVLDLPKLPVQNSRLERHIAQLLHLVDPATLPCENTDEAVDDFDDRFRRASAKVTIIERILGENRQAGASGREQRDPGKAGSNIEDVASIPKRLLPEKK